jgi:hypothetical protein
MEYKCAYCADVFNTFKGVIEHTAGTQPSEEIKICVVDNSTIKAIHFKIIPD